MQKRKLGSAGPEISEIGLGCWQIGADWGDGMSQEAAFEILSAAVESGISFFDTADVYGDDDRQSERFIGQFTSQGDTPIKVATKFGRNRSVYPDRYTQAALRESVLESQKCLQVDQIELLQLHTIPTEILRQGDIFDWLRELQREGLIRNFGASVETVEEGLICLEQEGFTSLQVIFNIFRQKLVKELLPQAKEKGVGLIVRLPLASGLLTGKMNASTVFHEDDHRNYNQNGEYFNVGETFAGLPFAKGVELADAIKTMLPEEGTMAQLALRWILDHDAVTTVIPGASSPQQAKDNAAAAALPPLSSELHAALTDFYAQNVHAHIRGPY